MWKPALSIRIAESPRDKSRLAAPIGHILDLARDAGIQGISMRASGVSVTSSHAEVRAVAREVHQRGLSVSMVTGDLALAINNHQATAAIRGIQPYLALSEMLGARLVRIMVHTDDDIPYVQRAADLARERGISLVQQTHWGSLAETVDDALYLMHRIGRSNVGLTFEPANLLAAGSAYSGDAIKRLAPHLLNVYFQNVCLDEASPIKFATKTKGGVGVRFAPLVCAEGIDVRPIVSALREVGYDSWFTVHQPLLPGQTLAKAVMAAGQFLTEASSH